MVPGQCEPDPEGHPFRVIMRRVMRRGWRATVAAVGLLVLAGCVVLVVVLTVADRQDDAARVGGILGIVFGAIPLAIPLIWLWRRAAINSAPTAGQDTIAEGTQPIGSPVDRRVPAWPHYVDASAVQAAGDRSVEKTAKRRRALTAVMIAFAQGRY